MNGIPERKMSENAPSANHTIGIVKRCSRCKKVKSGEEFHKDRSRIDGLQHRCRSCTKELDHKRYILNGDKIRDYSINYNKNNRAKRLEWRTKNSKRIKEVYNLYRQKEDKEKRLQRVRKYEKKYPDRSKAKTAINNAIKSGKIEKGICAICDSNKYIQGHHDDYSKPMQVDWLCRKCHYLWHQLLREWERQANVR